MPLAAHAVSVMCCPSAWCESVCLWLEYCQKLPLVEVEVAN